ncbi:ABC transporter substrate-binding protein [Limobrevibacterium gyesilva]|uniref:ABC transporter substrate-binding protein n=1 Tax=Limobrevibacterium gyesilva TaxID=2991712 RepID=A0AA41YKU9_9PROT|nr:ABC transporter substrate-binding protein [Limobrevibacterium gyesilva]MCW3474236.1 ABC transporter substrate-binding protein [Limobrevibacterium gyesilva]
MITRRTLLGAAAAASLATRASAAGQVVVATWGGDYGELLTRNVEKPLLTPVGIEAVQDLGSQDARKTKLIAEKVSRRGSLDVVHLSDTDMYQMAQAGVFEDVDLPAVPNAANIIKGLRRPYSIPHILSAQVILYNPDKIEAPKGFADLWNPKYKGRVAIPDLNYPAVTFGSAIAGGGGMSNWQPAKKMLLDLKKNEPKIYPSHEQLAQALKAEEVWITPMWLARGFMWRKAGIKLAHAVPEEGAIPVVFEAAVPKNARNKAHAWAYLNAMLDPQAQLGFADRMGYVPTVTNATLPAEIAGQIGFTPAEQEKFRVPDYSYQAKVLPEILDFWNKEFKA